MSTNEGIIAYLKQLWKGTADKGSEDARRLALAGYAAALLLLCVCIYNMCVIVMHYLR